MNWVDLGMIIALALAAVSGWRQGLVQALAMLVSLFIGLALAARFGADVGSLILENNDGAWVLGFAIILIVAVLAGFIGGKIAQKVVHLLLLGWVDRVGGLIASVVLMVLLLSALVVAAVSIEASPDWLRGPVKDSALGSRLAAGGEWLRPGWSWAQEKLKDRLPAL